MLAGIIGLVAWPVAAQPYGLTQRPVVGAFMNGILPPAEANPTTWQAVEAFPNVTFADPIAIVAEPRANRLYVCGRQGTIHFITNTPSVSSKTLFLDLSAVTQGYNDSGLLGMAFHPQYGVPGNPNRGYVYVYYNYSPSPVGPGAGGSAPSTTPNYNRLSRFTVPDGTLIADRNSELVLINQYDRHLWHNGGGMFFGPDGFLYLTNGDEGGADDSYNQTQKINSGLFSGVLRIDVDMDPARSHPIRRQPVSGSAPPGGWPPTFTTNYYIPNDNPWVTNNNSVLEEFYAIGLRSPHRMTYDALTDRIWLGDVGQATWEEVSVIQKGGNYQWAYREGDHTGPKTKPNPIIGTDQPPVHDYQHVNGNNCVIGGYVYRGSQFPSLHGKYIFGDNGSSRVWAMTYDGVNPTVVTQLCVVPTPANTYGLATFGVDENNEIYMAIVGASTKLYKLAAAGAQPPAPPPLLSQTGVFTNLPALAPHPAMVPFNVNSPLWSDHAAKQRWMIVPNNGAPYGPGETIGYTSNGNWSFPTGTVLVKHFDLPVNDTNPSVLKRLETRFLIFGTNAQWFGFTYKWRADNSDADLLPGGLSETNLITTATGLRTQVWAYPSRTDCRTCHTPNAGGVLGPRTRQLNGDLFYPATGVTDNQLRALNHVGMFDTNLNEALIPALPKTHPLTDTNASLELRVRSYLDANCAHCHQPNGVRGNFDARFSTPLEAQGLVNGTVEDSLGISGARVIRPQSPAQSILHVRDNALGSIAMPPLAKNVVDTNYINVLAAWINSLPPVIELPAGLPGLMGNTNTSTASDNLYDVAPYINATRFQASSNFTAAFIRARITNVVGNYKCALYAGTSSAPGALLGTTATLNNPATGWQTFPFSSPLSLTNGNYYWLAIWSDSPNARVFHSGTGVVRWGQYNFGAWPDPLVTSGGGTLNYSIYAASGARPVFDATPANRTLGAGSQLMVTNRATDADIPAQFLTYYLLNSPEGASVNGDGVITWQPTMAQSPSTNTITTAATDGVFSITNSFQVVVTNVGSPNTPPAFVLTPPDAVIAEHTLLTVTNAATDSDAPPDTLAYQLLNAPAGAGISAAGVITWTPAEDQGPGTNVLVTVVSDGALSATNQFTVVVTEVNVPPAFVLTPPDLIVAENTLLTVTNAATDTDEPANPLTYQLVNPPGGAAISAAGVITWLTGEVPGQGAETNVIASVVSDGSLSVTNTFQVIVTNVNQAPLAIADALARWVTQGVSVPPASLLTNDTDADGDLLALVTVTNATPSGATLLHSNNLVTYWPVFGDTNAGSFNYIITDGHNGYATGLVSVSVLPDPAGDDILNLTAQPGADVVVGLAGIPGFTYTVQYADTLTPPVWQNLLAVTANELGQITVTNTMPEGSTNRFYRAVRGLAP